MKLNFKCKIQNSTKLLDFLFLVRGMQCHKILKSQATQQ